VLADTDGDPVEQSCAVAREGALLQREVAPHVAHLEGAGLRRLGPAEATTYVATRTEQYAALAEGDPRRLDADAAARLRARLNEVEAWADRLLGLGLPLTLVHNDLHGHNVFSVGGRMRFFDFGDAMLGDPLSVLLVVVRSLMFRLECEPDDPRLTRVSEAALEPWTDLAPLPDLREALDAGLQLGKLARAESWVRCLRNLTDAETVDFGDAGTYWLQAIEAPALQTE
jgi:Ser/Thr protein kinase RdoA (MazF antagonist)